MPLAVYVFSGILFLLGGLLWVFEGATFGSAAQEIRADSGEKTPVFAAIPQQIQQQPEEKRACSPCAGRLALPVTVRPVAKPVQREIIAQTHESPPRRADLIRKAHWEYAAREGALVPVPVVPAGGLAPDIVPESLSGLAFQDAYWVRPVVLETGRMRGFHLYGAYLDASGADGSCWTESHDPAGAVWTPDDCRPSALRPGEAAHRSELPRSAYRVGFTTKIRHSVVGLRISRKLN